MNGPVVLHSSTLVGQYALFACPSNDIAFECLLVDTHVMATIHVGGVCENMYV